MRLSSVMWVVVVVCAASLLYSVKYKVQAMDEEIAVLRGQIEEERAALHVLGAEWAFLTRPDRVRELADKYLDVQPLHGKQFMELADIPYSPDSAVRLADGSLDMGTDSVSELRPGVIPAGGAGYVR